MRRSADAADLRHLRPGTLAGRLATAAAAAAAMLAVLLSSRLLGIAALALAGLVLAGAIYALLRTLLRPLSPLARRVRAIGRAIAAPFLAPAQRIRSRVQRLRERAIDALLALDRRLGEPFARTARRVPARVRDALLYVPRFNAWLAAVIVCLLGLALAIYVVSGWLGAALAGRTTPVAAEWLYLGAFITATVAALVLAFWIWELGRVVLLHRLRARTCATGAVLAVLVGIGLLSTPEVPGELAGGQEAAKRDGGRATDVLVVVDPADPAGRQLADYVRGDLPALAAPRGDALAYEVALGLAAPADPALATGGDPWTVLEPPTANRRHFLDSVAAVAPGEGRRATRAYAALLDSLRDPGYLPWHGGARRAVALVLAELPLEADLDSATASWSELVSAYAAGRGLPRPVVFTQEGRRNRIALWREWLARMHGRLVTYRQADAALLADVEDTATGAGLSAVARLARAYNPRLRFDGDEQFFPVDVDDLLRKGGGHEVCDHVRLFDNCEPLDEYGDLLGALDEYIDFEGGARLGRDLVDRDVRLGVRPAIYVDAIERGDRLELAYWWFLRYNVSPWRPERNCLPGFTFAEATCFDHEGDWEGVTVTLGASGSPNVPEPYAAERWQPLSVSFASHSKLTRWDWERLERSGTHPVVYVAQGSHAAYPARCSYSCTQKLAGPGLPPEGRFDGAIDWRHNGSACCLPLPVTPDHRGALWNAFPGRWGKAVCTAFVKVCSQSDGPRSPSGQRRFDRPEGSTFPDQVAVLERHRKRYGTAADES